MVIYVYLAPTTEMISPPEGTIGHWYIMWLAS